VDLGTSTSNIKIGNISVDGINIADAYYHLNHGLGPGKEPPNSETLKEEAIKMECLTRESSKP
jgi:hypothetical protein